MTQGPIPLVDLQAAHQEVAAEIEVGFERVISNTAFILGPELVRFEEEYAEFIGARQCVGMSSGTDALELALRSLDIGSGDEVVVPVNTFAATALAVVRAGATPVFVDCDDRHLLLDHTRLEEVITDRTRAVVPVHLFGQAAPMAEILEIARRHGLYVVEDAAQAQGAIWQGKNVGTVGIAAATSFYPGKNLGAYGDAGAVTTNDDGLAQRLLRLRNYGSTQKYHHPELGFNCRLDTLQAVVLRAKLSRLRDWNERRREAAAFYDDLLGTNGRVRRVESVPGNVHIYHLYVVRISRRDAILERLQAAGIGAGIHYPRPLHRLPAFQGLVSAERFPVAERACEEILSLPLFPQITPSQQERVVRELSMAIDGVTPL